jgi:transcriptional regulator with XRE-family HTH domain
MVMAAPNGPTIEALRKQRGWKRRELTERVGCSYSTLYNLERGFTTGSEELLQRIATALEVPLGEVMEKKPRRAPTTSPAPSRPIPPPKETKPPTRVAGGKRGVAA